MLRLAGRTLVRLIVCAPVVAFMPSAVAAPLAAEGETASISPWEIEEVYKNDRFDRCAISRNLDGDISVTFMRTGKGLSLMLASPHWKLETGKTYPVTLKLGQQSWDREVGAKASAVSMVVEDASFVSGLGAANALELVAAGDTIHVPLDGSAAAFERLDQCAAKNGGEPSNQPVCDGVVGGTDSKACTGGTEAKTKGAAARDAIASSKEEIPPPPAARPAVEVKTEETPAEDAIATSEEEVPPPPAAKPAADGETEGTSEDAIASSEEEVPPPPDASPTVEGETEGAPPENVVTSSDEENAPPPSAKPEKAPVEPAVKKASPKKKQTTQSSAQSAKRAFKREVDRLRRFFGN